MKIYKIVLFVLLNLSINGLCLMATECERPIPTSCEKKDMNVYLGKQPYNYIICSIKEDSQLRFDVDKKNENITQNRCGIYDFLYIIIKPDRFFNSKVKLSRKSIDAKSFLQYISTIQSGYSIEFQSFKGFDLQLFHDSDINIATKFNMLFTLTFIEPSLRFYIGDKQMKSCQDFYDLAQNFSSPSSIFNIINMFYKGSIFNYKTYYLNLKNESKDKLCPLVFKNVLMERLYLFGDNSFFSRRLIKFSNETFADLNTTISELHIDIANVEVNFELVHPSIFQETELIAFSKKNKINSSGFFRKIKKYEKDRI